MGSAPTTQLSLFSSGTVGAGQLIGGGSTHSVPASLGTCGTLQVSKTCPESISLLAPPPHAVSNTMLHAISKRLKLAIIFILLSPAY